MSSAKVETKKRIRGWVFLAVGAVVLLAAGIAYTNRQPRDPLGGLSADVPTFAVAEGPLTINVTASGTIRPREQVILKNEVEGQTSIIYLIKEGTQVKKGDLLVELDSSQMMDEKVNQEIQVFNAEAAFIQARENLEVVKNQAKADIDKAKLDLEFAKQDLSQYKEGEFPKLEKEAKAKIALAEETLTNAKNTIEWSKRLYTEKYLSESELKKDELTAQKAQLDLDLANGDLKLLQDFTYKRNVATFESNVSQTSMTLERVQRKASADLAQAEAQLKAKEAEYKQQQDQLAKTIKQIEKTKIVAPMEGTVIYATSTRSGDHFRGGSQEPLDEGQAVRERQELIYLPTTSSFDTEIKVHESSLDKIQVGQPVLITVDALPGRSFTGRISVIAPLPDPQSFFMNPDLKVYNTLIQLDGDIAELRNGMSCRAEIIVDEYDKAVYVPIQAVMRVAGKTVAYVREGNQFKMRPIMIGLDNNRMVHVTSGLKAGEVVMMAPPLSDAEAAPASGQEIAGAVKRAGQATSGTLSGKAVSQGPRGPRSGSVGERSGAPDMDAGRSGAPGTGEGRPGGFGPGEGRSGGFNGTGGDGSGAPGMGGERKGGEGRGGSRFSTMTPEQREEMRKRFESMSPEERAKMSKMRGSRSGGSGRGPSAGGESGRGPSGDGESGRGPSGGGSGRGSSGGGRE